MTLTVTEVRTRLIDRAPYRGHVDVAVNGEWLTYTGSVTYHDPEVVLSHRQAEKLAERIRAAGEITENYIMWKTIGPVRMTRPAADFRDLSNF
jgi:hypothetical protein